MRVHGHIETVLSGHCGSVSPRCHCRCAGRQPHRATLPRACSPRVRGILALGRDHRAIPGAVAAGIHARRLRRRWPVALVTPCRAAYLRSGSRRASRTHGCAYASVNRIARVAKRSMFASRNTSSHTRRSPSRHVVDEERTPLAFRRARRRRNGEPRRRKISCRTQLCAGIEARRRRALAGARSPRGLRVEMSRHHFDFLLFFVSPRSPPVLVAVPTAVLPTRSAVRIPALEERLQGLGALGFARGESFSAGITARWTIGAMAREP